MSRLKAATSVREYSTLMASNLPLNSEHLLGSERSIYKIPAKSGFIGRFKNLTRKQEVRRNETTCTSEMLQLQNKTRDVPCVRTTKAEPAKGPWG